MKNKCDGSSYYYHKFQEMKHLPIAKKYNN